MRRLAALALAALLYAPPAPAQQGSGATATVAQPDDYEIELIVFSHRRALVASERWPAQVLAPDVEGAVELDAARDDGAEAAGGGGVRAVAPSRLLAQAERLREHGSYEVLVHTAWRQPGVEAPDAPRIRLRALPLAAPVAERRAEPWKVTVDANAIAPEASYRPAAVVQASPAVGPDSPGGNAAPQAPPRYAEYALDGTVLVGRSRFLHLYTDLAYTLPRETLAHAIAAPRPPPPGLTSSDDGFFDPPPEPPPVQSFPVRYHRRMRSNEVHYLDHPLIGIVVLATRLEHEGEVLTD